MRYLLLTILVVCGLTTSAQVPDYVPTDGLVAWFPFDPTSENVELDFDVSVGQFSAAVDRFGNLNAASFINESEVLISTQGTVIPTATFSFSFWAHTDAGQSVTTAIHPIHGQTFGDANSNVGAGVWLGSGYFALVEHSSDFVRKAVEIEEDFSGWHHFVVSYSGNAAVVFIDGVLAGQSDAVGRTVNAPLGQCSYYPSFGIGFGYGSTSWLETWSGNRFLGALDDFAVWNNAIDQSMVEDLYYSSYEGGCADEQACNFDSAASLDDGSCEYGCLNCGPGTIWDDASQLCIVANPSDTDFDGCVSMTDLLDLLSVFGTCNETPWSCGDPLEYQGYDYETVQIGEQCWFAENLRAETYRNGDAIPTGLSDADWQAAEAGAVTIYQNDESYLMSYGRLYNWFAAIDERALCPNGWHVPADSEWTVLTDGLGGDSIAGEKMKAIDGWNGTNSSGFSGLPGGNRRDSDGNYYFIEHNAFWWSNTIVNDKSVDRSLGNHTAVIRTETSTQYGLSVRCLKDSE